MTNNFFTETQFCHYRPIWNYFYRHTSKAECRVCYKRLSLGSDLPKKQTHASLKRHLKAFHIGEWHEFLYYKDVIKKDKE